MIKIAFLYSLFFLSILVFGNEEVNISIESPNRVEINKEFLINIKISKDNYNSIARFEINFPVSIKVTEIESSSAIFISQPNTVKFVWINIPKQNIINLSFKVSIDYFTDENIEFISKYNYINNNDTKTTTTIKKLTLIKPSDIAKSKAKREEVTKSIVNVKRRILFELATKLDKDLVYIVQIAALKSNKKSKQLIKLIDSDFEIKEQYVDGFYKYYFGNFYSLETANMCKDFSGIKGAFVIPYYKG